LARLLTTIVVKSTPPGAWVFLDDTRHKEPTPTEIENVTAGEKHEIRVQKRGYKPWVRTVEPQDDKPLPLQATLARLLTTIVVKSTPPGAWVFLDDMRHKEPTPTVIEKVPVGGRCEIRVQKRGYKPWVRTVEPESGEPLPVEATLERLAGTIVVKSTPPGASVFLDGKEVSGSTPIEFPNVSADETHKIQVKKKGYETEVQTITLKANERRELRVVLKQPLSGEIRISSIPPGAEIYLNGTYMRDTPTRLSGLSQGNYTVRLEKEGYTAWEKKVIVRASEPLDLRGVKLQEALGWLNLHVSPWADVYHKGKKVGTTPLANIPLQEGTHKLLLKNPPLNIEREITVEIVAGKVTKKGVDIMDGVKGVLKIKVHPWADVYVDGKPKGTTPLKPIELMAGEHIVLVKNEKLGKERSFPIVIKPNEVVSREVDLLNE
jgi:hypothetical protein